MHNGKISNKNVKDVIKVKSKVATDYLFSNTNVNEANGFSQHNQSFSMEFNENNSYQQGNFMSSPNKVCYLKYLNNIKKI